MKCGLPGWFSGASRHLAKDRDELLAFYDFPAEHWVHLRTTNPIESMFATVRLRTNAATRFKKSKSGVYLMHQVIEHLSKAACY